MKNILERAVIFVLTAAATFQCVYYFQSGVSASAVSGSNGNVIVGDVNRDKEITVSDATDIQKYLASIITKHDIEINAADTDADGQITISDATEIQRFAASIINELPHPRESKPATADEAATGDEAMPWSGKSVCCFGDSTTYGDNGLHNGTGGNAISWTAHLSRLCGFSTVYNKGYNGSCVADKEKESSPSFCDRVRMLPDADLYVVMGGINDHWQSIPLGDAHSADLFTFRGAYRYIIDSIKSNHPNAQIAIITCAKYNSSTVPSGSSVNLGTYWTNRAGLLQQEYVYATKSIAQEYDLPVLDLFENSNINPFDEEQKMLYMGDGIHYLEAGYERLAEGVIAPYINSLSS